MLLGASRAGGLILLPFNLMGIFSHSFGEVGLDAGAILSTHSGAVRVSSADALGNVAFPEGACGLL